MGGTRQSCQTELWCLCLVAGPLLACTSAVLGDPMSDGVADSICVGDVLVVTRSGGEIEEHDCEGGHCVEEPEPHCEDSPVSTASLTYCCVPQDDWGFVRRDCDTGQPVDVLVYLDVRCTTPDTDSNLCVDGLWRCAGGFSEECVGGTWTVRSSQPSECEACGMGAEGTFTGEYSCACSPLGTEACPAPEPDPPPPPPDDPGGGGGGGGGAECSWADGDYKSCSKSGCYEAFKFCVYGDVWGSCVCCDPKYPGETSHCE